MGPPVAGPPVVSAPVVTSAPSLPPGTVVGPPVVGPPVVSPGGPVAADGPVLPILSGGRGAPLPPPGVLPPAGVAPPQVLPPGYELSLTITPTRIVAPVGSEVVLLAGVFGLQGRPLPNERVEWMLAPDSVGQFVAIGDRAPWYAFRRLHDMPGKVSNNYAIGSTSPRSFVLPRGAGGIGGPTTVAVGQSWISLTSATDGTSHVTAVAPQALNWQRRRQTATIYWVDGQFSFPAPAVGAVGARHPLTTIVTRQSDGTPVENWLVHYEVAGGAPAAFGPLGAPAVDVPTDAQGRATIEVFQQQPTRGTSQIEVQVIRPAVRGSSDRRLMIGRGGTTVTWTAAELGMNVVGPATAEVGATATYRITLANAGDLPVNGVVVSGALPAGATFLRSNPPADTSQGVRWRLDRIDGRQTTAIDVDLRLDQVGPARFCATTTTASGMRGQDCAADTNVVSAGAGAAAGAVDAIEVRLAGPQQAAVGENVTYRITLRNKGSVPLNKLAISDAFDAGLQHASSASPILRDLEPLAPGQVRDDLAVTFRVTQPGRLCQRVEVSGPGLLTARAETCLTAGAGGAAAPGPAAAPAPGLEVRKEGPRQMQVGQTGRFILTITNTGNTPLRSIKVNDVFDQGLNPVNATENYKLEEGILTWRYDTLAAGESKMIKVEAKAVAGVTRACTRGTVSAEGGLLRADEQCVEISPAATVPAPAGPPVIPAPAMPPVNPGVPPMNAGPAAPAEPGGLKVEVSDLTGGATVGRTLVYEVRITNQRDVSDRQVVLTVNVPVGMTPQPSLGPTAATITGQTIRFAPVAELRRNEGLPFRISVRADRAGRARLEFAVSSQAEQRPIPATAEVNVAGE